MCTQSGLDLLEKGELKVSAKPQSATADSPEPPTAKKGARGA